MKILILVRYDFFSKFGGDTSQILKYKEFWENNGHDVVISSEKDFSLIYDLYLVVNIDRILETIYFLNILKNNNLINKSFLLTIHHSYKDISFFELTCRKGILGLISKYFGFFGKEKIKSIYLGFKNKSFLLFSIKLQLFSVRKIIKNLSDDLTFIFIAEGEKSSFESDFGFKVNKYIITKNGCFIENYDIPLVRNTDVLISGRIELRKNSLNIAKQLSLYPNINVKFVGGLNSNNKKFCSDFLSFISQHDNISYIGKVEYEELKYLYLDSKTHISASWFEVSSLVDLESYYYGCNVISSSKGYTKEFLGNNAMYINPNDLTCLKNYIDNFTNKKISLESRRDFIKSNHNWETNSLKLIRDMENALS